MKKIAAVTVPIILLALVLIYNYSHQETKPKIQPEETPEEVFLKYSNAIDLGEYEKALNMCVVEVSGGFKPLEKHQLLQRKLSMVETYGEKGERFSIIKIEIERRENFSDRVRLHYRMKYSLDGRQSEIREYIDLVRVNGTWRIIFP